MKYYIQAFRKYIDSNGRASRREIVWFYMFHYLVVLITSFIDAVGEFYPPWDSIEYGYVTLAYLLISASPAICLNVRRLHDIGKSGAWWFAGNIPLVSLYVLYLYLSQGDEGANEFGPSPRADAAGQPPEDYTQSRFCHNCGDKLLEGSKFCRRCGAAVTDRIQQ